jgi:hypothetical protein
MRKGGKAMRPSRRLWKRLAALAGCWILITGPAILGSEEASPLRISGYSVTGDTVRVTVVNTGGETLTGTIFAHVQLEGRDAMTWARVTFHGAGKAFVDLRLPSEVFGVITLGAVLDDGCPF